MLLLPLQIGRFLCHSAVKEKPDSADRMSSLQGSHGRRILVGVSVDSKASSELLSWGMELLTRSNDTVIALHVIIAKEGTKICSDVKRFRQAKASVISMLGEFAEISQAKQVRLEAKVRSSSSVGEGIAEEATLLEANFLLLGCGSSRISSQSKSYLITKYCFKHIPENCSLIVMGKQTQSLLPQDPPSESAISESKKSPY
ncbi:hypothetical protein KFK09_028595 [Dendrobium nobile]|uniref:UspA domain-containing protein n=1 Tax=Dendrobium nobile TaxID=94219 RepID=A0A8T3A322_DENNO|nr:hypothetical protein KFK09_028595 [Dendrobium nobile]